MPARRFLVVFVAVVVVASYQMAVAADPESDDRVFDLRPSLDEALVSQLTQSKWNPETDPLQRQERAAALMMPMMAPAGGGGGSSTATKRRPGNWLVGGSTRHRGG